MALQEEQIKRGLIADPTDPAQNPPPGAGSGFGKGSNQYVKKSDTQGAKPQGPPAFLKDKSA